LALFGRNCGGIAAKRKKAAKSSQKRPRAALKGFRGAINPFKVMGISAELMKDRPIRTTIAPDSNSRRPATRYLGLCYRVVSVSRRFT
jgi:hypothetical protein